MGELPSDLTALIAALSSSLLAPTTAASQLPSPADLSFARVLSRPLSRSLDSTSTRVFDLVEKVLSWSDAGRVNGGTGGKVDGELVVEGAYRDVIDRVEWLLEGSDGALDSHYVGASSQPAKAVPTLPTPVASGSTSASSPAARLPSHILLAPNLPKPQLCFSERLRPAPPSIDAFPSETPLWKPLVTPSTSADQDPTLEIETYIPSGPPPASALALVPEVKNPPPIARFSHPYALTLANLTPPSSLFVPPTEPPPKKPPTSFDETPFEMIGDKAGLEKLLEEIRKVGQGVDGKKELAVDLEHHEARTWFGVTCLMQISTREKDYLVDVLEPSVRDSLHLLNEFFTNPEWVKVFHGAQSDILWLQRDFGLYIVGLFDTYHACFVLDLPQKSLASLLAKYTDFVPDKRYQLADWRIRPLPSAMSHYARSDTHFLLDIYDSLRIDILALPPPGSIVPSPLANPNTTSLLQVFDRSTSVSKGLFELKPYDTLYGLGETGWRNLLTKWRKLSNFDAELSKQLSSSYSDTIGSEERPWEGAWGPGGVSLEILRSLHYWREKVAREEDESPNWVMRNDFMLEVIEAKPLTAEAVLRLGGGNGAGRNWKGVGEVVRRRVKEVVEAVEEGMARVGKKEVAVKAPETLRQAATSLGAGLWSSEVDVEMTDVGATVGTSKSSFFGKKKSATKVDVKGKGKEKLGASSSSFFGSSKGKGKKEATVEGVEDLEWQRREAVKRVQGLLVLGGGLADSLRANPVPTPPSQPLQSLASSLAASHIVVASTDVDMISFDPPAAEREPETSHDHTFVPRSARQPPAQSDSDVIVVSSLGGKKDKSGKSKKRGSETEAGPESEQTSLEMAEARKAKKQKKKKEREVGAVEAFDYSTTKSVLDAEPVATTSKGSSAGGNKKKDKKEGGNGKGFTMDTSGFGKQPREKTQSKKGNVSKSFAK